MSVEADFDQLALLDDEGWTANNHYHDSLLKHVPQNCENALEIGCGTGAFARELAKRCKRVVGIDMSKEMIRVARKRAEGVLNLEFELADVMRWEFPQEWKSRQGQKPPKAQFDFVCSIATLHHLEQRELLVKIREAMRPGGGFGGVGFGGVERLRGKDDGCRWVRCECRFEVDKKWKIAATGRGTEGVGATWETRPLLNHQPGAHTSR